MKMNKELKDYTTKELTEELIKRDAISSEHILPYERFEVRIDKGITISGIGPAILIINQDQEVGKMTVGELINKLKDFDNNRSVFVRSIDSEDGIVIFEIDGYNECKIYSNNDGVIIDIVDQEAGQMIKIINAEKTDEKLIEMLQNEIINLARKKGLLNE